MGESTVHKHKTLLSSLLPKSALEVLSGARPIIYENVQTLFVPTSDDEK